MKKKLVVNIVIVLLILGMFITGVEATNTNATMNIEPRTTIQATETQVQSENTLQEESTGKLIEMKEKELKSIEDYNEKYGSEAYGMTAYLLNKIRIYSIPFAFVGIAIAAIFQYVIGIRKLDVRDRGFGVMIAIITVFVICQILPLIFAIVVKGFRG